MDTRTRFGGTVRAFAHAVGLVHKQHHVGRRHRLIGRSGAFNVEGELIPAVLGTGRQTLVQVGLCGRHTGLPPTGLQRDVLGDRRIKIVFRAVQIPAIKYPAWPSGVGRLLSFGISIYSLRGDGRTTIGIERHGMAGYLPLRVQGQRLAFGRIGDGRTCMVGGAGAVGLRVPSGERVTGAGELVGRRGGRCGARLGCAVQVFAVGGAVADIFDGTLTCSNRIGDGSVPNGAGFESGGLARASDLGRVGGRPLFRGGIEADDDIAVHIIRKVAVGLQILVGGIVVGFRTRVVPHGLVTPQGTHIDGQVDTAVLINGFRPSTLLSGGAFLRRRIDASHAGIVAESRMSGVVCRIAESD